VVVAVHRRPAALLRGERRRAGAQVPAGAERGVVDVLRVRRAVVVGVRAVAGPRAGQELHRPDRAVVAGVAVVPAAVRVVDRRGAAAAAVQADAEDRRRDEAVGLHLRAPEAAVVALDAADAGQDRPRQLARRVGAREVGRRGVYACCARSGMPVEVRPLVSRRP
jgi:hypothetical protein